MSTWIVPGLGTDNPAVIEERLARDDARRAIAALARTPSRGGAVAASCSAVFLLQAAGLLANRRGDDVLVARTGVAAPRAGLLVDADRMVSTTARS